jgi:radical SAM protein with 4Fe4S-binding SPASM domain
MANCESCKSEISKDSTKQVSFNKYSSGLRSLSQWVEHKTGRDRIHCLRFTITWRCNSKCISCAIWKKQADKKLELSVDEVDKIARDPYLKWINRIVISGGEPTLREDFPELISVLHKNFPHAHFGMTLNGLTPLLTEKMFKKILNDNPDIDFRLVGLSLNGPSEIHDRTRGVEGSFEKAIETYHRIKNLVPTQFSFTFMKENVNQFEWVKHFARELGTSAYICWTVMNDRFDTQEEDLKFQTPGLSSILKRHVLDYKKSAFNVVKNMHYLNLSYQYDSVFNKRIMPCFAGKQIMHLDPEGNVFPCDFNLSKERNLGSVREKSAKEIIEGASARILEEIQCGKCMYPNGLCGDSDIYYSISNSVPVVLLWLLKKTLTRELLISEKSRIK